MNNIAKILAVLELLGNEISLTELVDEISRKYHIVNDEHLFTAIKYAFETNKQLFEPKPIIKGESELSKIIHLEDYTYVGHGGDQEIKDNPKFLCDIFEALVGAIYMDLGFEKAKSFVMQQLGAYINQVGINNLIVTSKDFKSRLQELVQADTKRTVEYVLVEATGPTNAPSFTYEVTMDGLVLGQGKGPNKKVAQQEAAKDALSKMAK